jgi:hypothetical protein
LKGGDALAIEREESIQVNAITESEFLLFDLE